MFRKISPFELSVNPFAAFDRQWALITCETPDGRVNPMTASWGGVGIMWNYPAATCYIRPQRYTQELLGGLDRFAICFTGEEYRDALKLCGRVSGRDCDKAAEAGLTVCREGGVPYFEQSELVLICRKLYCQQLASECFVDAELDRKNYNGDYHFMYISEITDCLVRE